jgi:hypothetical protein
MSIMIGNKKMEGHKVVCIMISLEIYAIDILLLNTIWNYFYQLCQVKKDMVDPLTKVYQESLYIAKSTKKRVKEEYNTIFLKFLYTLP